MRSLRSTWLALIGAMLLVTLSVSAAFGAAPNGTAKQTRGQTIAAQVHDVIFGTLEEEHIDECEAEEAEETEQTGATLDEEEVDECETDANECDAEETEETGATLDEEEVDECETDADELEGDREVPEGFANHGECVSTAAKDRAGSEASEAANHGAWVSEHARYTCWSLEPPTSDEEEDLTEAETAAAASKAEQKADGAAARAEKKAERAEAKPAKANSGGGKPQGKGGGRP